MSPKIALISIFFNGKQLALNLVKDKNELNVYDRLGR